MDELTTLHPHGLFLRREAQDHGYRDRDLLAARRAGVLHRVRHGAYVTTATWDAMDAIARYRLRGQAVCLVHGDRVALSHTSAAVEHGMRVWDADLTRVHVLRLDGGSGRRTHDIDYHEDTWTPGDLLHRGELMVLGPERSALGAASLMSVDSGVVLLDSVIDLGLADLDDLRRTHSRQMASWPFSAKLQVTVRLTRPGSQSAGESLGRQLFWRQHLPEPVLQFEVRDADGVLIGITDYAWPEHGLLGEFDGRIKYLQPLRPGERAEDVVVREKDRENALREITGWMMIRLIWSDLHSPEATAARIRRMMRPVPYVA